MTDLLATLKSLCPRGPTFLAVVLARRSVDSFALAVQASPSSVSEGLLYGAPVYVKDDQPEPYRLFTDRAELAAYLRPPGSSAEHA